MLGRVERLASVPWPLRVAAWQRFKNWRRGFSREHYFLCVERAAKEAAALGHEAISVIEFGVAAGNGLVELERVAEYVERLHPVRIQVYGFDTGKGLPPPTDYRDLPWKWQGGAYSMNVPKLQARLKRAALILGDVADTVPAFLGEDHAPIGAIMFDLDYYSSTVEAFQVLMGPAAGHLPRVYCYMDDVGSVDDIGVLLAIDEFNAGNAMRKLRSERNIAHDPNPYLRGWKIYGFHHYDHPDYCRPVRTQHA